jgi:acetoacetate decarboxylase
VKNSFTVPYRETAMLIHVRTPFGTGVHCPWMIVDDDSAMIYGRDQLAYPKKMGEFLFDESESNIKASINRRGIDILKMDVTKGKPEENPGPVFAQKFFNVQTPGILYLFYPIILFRAKEKITESFQADIKLTVNESPVDPIARLIDGDPISGRMVVMDITGGAYLLPVGFASIYWFVMNHRLRYQ